MSIDPETHYLQLGRLVATMPDFESSAFDSAEMHQWLGRVSAVLERSGQHSDATALNVKVEMLHILGPKTVGAGVSQLLHRALARAELAAPATAQGMFISAGDGFSAFAAVGKVLARATSDLLLIDAYADATILTDYVITAPERIPVRILTADKQARRLVLAPAVARWQAQFGSDRPLEVRFSPSSSLHDRLMLVDQKEAWTVGQSFNAMAERSHTSIVRADEVLAAMKVAAYEDMWQAGSLL
jgi:hypothetical protein